MVNNFFDIDRLNICFTEDEKCNSKIPEFYSYLLHAILNEENKKICFMFDKRPIDIYLLSILTSFVLLKKNSKSMVKNYLRRSFQKGERVLIKPQGFIYEYNGVFEPYDLIQLKLLNNNDKRSFQPHEMLRLQKTTKKRPAGKLDTELKFDEPTFIDSLLDIQTYDNHSFLLNQLILYTTKNKFNEFLSNVSLHETETKQTIKLKNMKLWGSIDMDGKLNSYDTRQSGGEPLVAVSSELEDIVVSLEDEIEFSKIVFFDDISKISKNLQAFDEISERQRSVVFGSINEMQEIEQYLKDTGFIIWQLDNNDLQFSSDISTNNDIFKKRIKKEINFPLLSNFTKKEMEINYILIENEYLNSASDLFNEISSFINTNDVHERMSDVAGKMFDILFNSLIQSFSPHQVHQDVLENISSELLNIKSLIDPKLYNLCTEYMDLMEIFQVDINDVSVTLKGHQLEKHIKGNTFSRILILSRDNEIKNKTQDYFKDYGFNNDDSDKKVCINVDIIKNLKKMEVNFYDAIFVDHWLGKNNFLKLYSSQICHNLIFMGYKIELQWLGNSLKILNKNISKFRLETEEKSEILNMNKSDLQDKNIIYNIYKIPFEDNRETSGEENDEPPAIIFKNSYTEKKYKNLLREFSDSGDLVEVKLIEYHGGYFSWNYDSHEVVIVKNLTSSSIKKMEVKPIKSKNLQVGNIVMFRSNSNKSIVSETAAKMIGIDSYTQIFNKAVSWKKSLKSIGSDPVKIQKKLEKNNLSRNLLTIKNWLSDVTVAPSNKEDLLTIIKTADDAEMLNELEDIWSCIGRLRGLHIKTGSYLTDSLIKELRNNPIDFDFEDTNIINLEHGEIELHQVSSVSTKTEMFSRQHANHIHQNNNLIL